MEALTAARQVGSSGGIEQPDPGCAGETIEEVHAALGDLSDDVRCGRPGNLPRNCDASSKTTGPKPDCRPPELGHLPPELVSVPSGCPYTATTTVRSRLFSDQTPISELAQFWMIAMYSGL